MATHLFQTLIRDVESELWNEHELAKLPLLELQSLADLLACARSGTKEEVTTKILAIRTIRLRLSGFSDDPQAVAAVFDRRALRQMCREACLWRSGNKRQLAAVLLTWRNRCRYEGQRRLEAALQATRQQPRQREFAFA